MLFAFLYNKYIIRNVDVVDTTKPVIELKGKEEINIYVDDKFEDNGYTASDNYDGDITDKIVILGDVDSTKEADAFFPRFNKDEWNALLMGNYIDENYSYKRICYTKKGK